MKISIITPCFNSEKTIRRTIESVLNQSGNFDMEYIIIDGKSTDNTLNIIKEYSEKYNFIKYKSEKDKSMTEALNKGFKMATGEIVASINADDEYIADKLDVIVDAFRKDCNKQVVVANCYIINEEDQSIMYKLCPKYINYLTANALDCTVTECHIFFRRKCIEKIGYFNENIRYTQDYELYLRLLKNGYKFNYLDQDLAKFYMSSDNYSTVVGDKMKEEAQSYVHYKWLHKLFSYNKFNQFIRVLLGIRKGVR